MPVSCHDTQNITHIQTANDNLACHVRIAQGGNSLGGETALLRVLADVLAGEINKRVWDV
jgi:hypothetical protein